MGIDSCFTNSGTFSVPGKIIFADVLVVGGGGGGGQDVAGGGGAGGLIFKPSSYICRRGIQVGVMVVITIGSGGRDLPIRKCHSCNSWVIYRTFTGVHCKCIPGFRALRNGGGDLV